MKTTLFILSFILIISGLSSIARTAQKGQKHFQQVDSILSRTSTVEGLKKDGKFTSTFPVETLTMLKNVSTESNLANSSDTTFCMLMIGLGYGLKMISRAIYSKDQSTSPND